MATAAITTQGLSGSNWVSGIFATIARNLRRRRAFNQTRRELLALSNRELADLGLGRGMITRVALEAAERTE